MKNNIYILFLAFTLIIASCEKTTEIFIGNQPKFEKGNTIEGLNVFCLLKPDSFQHYNKSFAYIQQIFPAPASGDLIILKDVEVVIQELIGEESSNQIKFPLLLPDTLNENTVFEDTIYRPRESFTPVPGNTYKMICSHPDFPTAVGECIFPSKPVIKPGSYLLTEKDLTFTLITDSLVKMIDFYLLEDDDSEFLRRMVIEGEKQVPIHFNVPFDLEGMRLGIYYYDNQLATYYANSNTSLNFNKLRLAFTTLESGYGVFGGINFLEISF